MNVLAHLRTLIVLVGAFALGCGLITQMLARTLGYAPELGPSLIDLGSLRLYAPFSFLSWTFAWAAVAPSLFALAICVVLICALAAYAAAIVVAKLEPIALAEASPWRDLAAWRELGHYGLLRDEGLALGAVRRHALARYRRIRSRCGDCIFLGEPRHTDDAVLAALGSWPGTLVLVDARGELANRLGRSDVQRFAPGRGDTLCFNPLLAIRGGLHAWGDARRLAASLLSGERSQDDATIDSFALLMLDQLLCAPQEARTLLALRRRLIRPVALLGELCARWADPPASSAIHPAIWEMTRVASRLRTQTEAALAHLAQSDRALNGVADAGLAEATSAHQLNLAQFVAEPAGQTLVLALAGDGAAPLLYAILAQLAALRADDSAQPMLWAIEADAARALAEQTHLALPSGADLRLLLQSADLAQTEPLMGGAAAAGAVVAIGPQTEASAEGVSKRAGRCVAFSAMPHRIPRWRDLLLPAWIKREVARLPAAALAAAPANEALLVAPDQRPVRMSVLVGGGTTRFRGATGLAAHAWEGPPMLVASPAPATTDAGDAATQSPQRAAKLRRVLTRPNPKSAPKGARIL